MSDEQIEEVLQEQRRIFELAMEQDVEGLTAAITATILKRLKALPEEQTASLGNLEEFASSRATQSIRAFQHPRYQFMLNHDFGNDWESVSAPVLGLFGELDVQVDARQNAEALKLACAKSGNFNVTTVVLPEANHLFVAAQTGSMTEYATMDKDFVPEFLPTISDWLAEQMGGE